MAAADGARAAYGSRPVVGAPRLVRILYPESARFMAEPVVERAR